MGLRLYRPLPGLRPWTPLPPLGLLSPRPLTNLFPLYYYYRLSNLSVSRFVRSWSRRFSGRACRCPQGQIFQHWRPILIWTHCDRDFRRAAWTARRLASSSLTLAERFPSVQAFRRKLERRAFSFRDAAVLVQRFNAVLLHNSLPATDCTDWLSYLTRHILYYYYYY